MPKDVIVKEAWGITVVTIGLTAQTNNKLPQCALAGGTASPKCGVTHV